MKRQQGGYAALLLVAGFVLVLLASLAGNRVLYAKWQKAKEATTAAETKLGQANEQTEACNASIAGLEAAARAQGAAGEKARQAAAERRKKRNQGADVELSTPATVPGNDCKSAQDRVDRILARRARP